MAGNKMGKLTLDMARAIRIGAAPAGYLPVTQLALLVMVGLTGAGKTTTLVSLRSKLSYTLLPDRREITDRVIIPRVLREKQEDLSRRVIDRVERFKLTRAYQELAPGGLSEALSEISINPDWCYPIVVFDGMRGKNEIEDALTRFALARFVMLKAADEVRLLRLVERRDAFDTGSLRRQGTSAKLRRPGPGENEARDEGVPSGSGVSLAVEARLQAIEEMRRIVVEEGKNYNVAEMEQVLANAAPGRALILDSAELPPDLVAERIIDGFHLDMRDG